jgi:hypothetical protein
LVLVALLAGLAATPAAAAKPQTIKFESTPPSPALVGGTYVVNASASSLLPVNLASATPSVCSLSGSSSGATASFKAEGTCTIDANQPGNSEWEAAKQANQTFQVQKKPQTIKFESTPPNPGLVGGSYGVSAAGGGSGNPVTLTIDAASSSVCSISGATVSFVAEGTCTIDANQVGNESYESAPQAQQPVIVHRKPQTIKFESTPPNPSVVGGSYNVSAGGGGSGNPVTLTIDPASGTACSISSATVSLTAGGTCTIDANQAGNESFEPAPQAQQTFTVHRKPQSVEPTSQPTAPAVGGTYMPTAQATSGLEVTFSTSTPSTCTVSGSTVTFVAPGSCTVNENQAGNEQWEPGQFSQTFPVAKGSQQVVFTSAAPEGAAVGGSYVPTATGGKSGNSVVLTVDLSSKAVCRFSGSTVSFIGSGTCTIDGNQAGSENYEAAKTETQSFAVHQLPQTVAFTSTPPNPAQVGGTYAVSATSSVPGFVVTFSVPTTSVCTISGSTVTFIAAGICTIDAEQPGNGEYAPAPQVQQSFIVNAPPAPAGPPPPGPIVHVKPVVIPNSSFRVVGASLSLATYAITFVESVSDPGTFTWVLTFQNGRFGVFAAAKTCQAGSLPIKGKCRPARVLFARGSQTVTATGSVTFTVKPTRAGVQALHKAFKLHKGLPVTADVTFQSARGGQPAVRVQSLIIKGRR